MCRVALFVDMLAESWTDAGISLSGPTAAFCRRTMLNFATSQAEQEPR